MTQSMTFPFTTAMPAAVSTFDAETVRAQFPILAREVNGKPLVYLDNAASSQKPQRVIDRLVHYYSHENSNVHRGVHSLSQQATDAYEGAREIIREYINAGSIEEVVFTRGCTEAINLVAATFGQATLKEGDEVLITGLEHHSNIVPWQMLCERVGAKLSIVPVGENGDVDLASVKEKLTDRTRIVALAHMSNALGTILPVEEIVHLAHDRGAYVVVDGAQAMPHMRVDVRALGADFYCFSGHKMFGPTGIGVLYGKRELLEAMPPYQGGGDMIETVSFEKTTFNTLPYKFEAGTPNIAGTIGLGEAVRFLADLDLEGAARHEAELVRTTTERLLKIDGLRIIGQAPRKASVVSFVVEGIHPYDIGTILDQLGIAVRTGHHCTQPLMDRFGLPGTVRASFAFYNTLDDVDRLVAGVERAVNMLR
jgi:cysteine desulfurase / selenocysteine lyase